MKKIDIIKNYIDIVRKNLSVIKELKTYLENTFPVESYENLSFEEKVKIDALVHRVSKLQDSLGRLIKFYLEFEGVDTSSLTPRDVYNIAEKYNLINSVEEWFMIRDLRNSIAHEYSLLVNELTDILNKIYDLSDRLIDIAENVIFIVENKTGEEDG